MTNFSASVLHTATDDGRLPVRPERGKLAAIGRLDAAGDLVAGTAGTIVRT